MTTNRSRTNVGLTAGLVLCMAALLPSLAGAQTAPPPAAPAPAVFVPVQEGPRTLLSRPLHSGGYGAPVVSYTRFAGHDSVMVGGRGGWVLNHQLVIGGGGFGLANPRREMAGMAPDLTDYQHNFGYGGVWLEYLIAPMNVVHASVGTLIGGGGITYLRRHDNQNMESTAVFVLDPVVGVEANITNFIRFGVQGGYRVVRGVELATLDNSDASGVTLGAVLKFGGF